MVNFLLLDLIILSLATWSAVEIWHHGELFTTIRLYFKEQVEQKTLLFWLGKLVLCPFCLSVWVAIVFCIFYNYIYWFIVALSVARLANLYNDITKFHNVCFTPTPTDQQQEFSQQDYDDINR